MEMRSRTQMLVLTGLSIALIAAGAFITIPFGPVPFTLQTLMIGIVICLLPPRFAVGAIGGYLLLGCLGLPIFSGFRGGIGVLAGPTGGFLIGFLVAIIVIAFIRSSLLKSRSVDAQKPTRSKWLAPSVDIASLVLLSVIYYVFGCAWFMVLTGTSLEATLAACLIPFIVPDIVKAVIAFFCAQSVRTALSASRVRAR